MDATGEDGDLVRQAVAGDAEAFHRLTVRYYRPVTGFVLRRIGRPDLVEDLVQETFLEAFQALRNGPAPKKFSSWLFGIAHNRCGKWLRRKSPNLFSPNESPELTAPSEEQVLEEREELDLQLARLRTNLQTLPAETQRLLELKYQGGKTCEEIAAEVGRPVGTVKSLLARTYKLLRQALTPQEESP